MTDTMIGWAPYGGTIYLTEPTGSPPMRQRVKLFRKGQKCRWIADDGRQVGPEQDNVAPAIAFARHSGWTEATKQVEPELPPPQMPWSSHLGLFNVQFLSADRVSFTTRGGSLVRVNQVGYEVDFFMERDPARPEGWSQSALFISRQGKPLAAAFPTPAARRKIEELYGETVEWLDKQPALIFAKAEAYETVLRLQAARQEVERVTDELREAQTVYDVVNAQLTVALNKLADAQRDAG